LLVVDHLHEGVPENIGIAAARFRVSPAHDEYGQFIRIKTFRHQANGSDLLRVLYRWVQRQNGDVVILKIIRETWYLLIGRQQKKWSDRDLQATYHHSLGEFWF
jgi:hypothetical protein